MDIFHEFVQDLEKYLGVRATKLSVKRSWIEDGPVEARGFTLPEWLNNDVKFSPILDIPRHFQLRRLMNLFNYLGCFEILYLLILETN